VQLKTSVALHSSLLLATLLRQKTIMASNGTTTEVFHSGEYAPNPNNICIFTIRPIVLKRLTDRSFARQPFPQPVLRVNYICEQKTARKTTT